MKPISTTKMELICGGKFNWREFGLGLCEGLTVGAYFIVNAPLTMVRILYGTGVGCMFI
jgi:hypothetical protein